MDVAPKVTSKWIIFNFLAHHTNLPLFQNRWKRYYPFHLKMLKDVEDDEEEPQVANEPTTRPGKGWLRRKVEKVAKACMVSLSQTAKKKFIAELKRAILYTSNGGSVECRRVHQSGTDPFVRIVFIVSFIHSKPLKLKCHTDGRSYSEGAQGGGQD
jgi:hypothetical protein